MRATSLFIGHHNLSLLRINWSGEVGRALTEGRRGLTGVVLLSAGINILMLSSSIYMMLVYDRVLPSASLPTLFGLFFLVTLLFLFQAGFDILRAWMLSDVAGAFEARLAPRVLDIAHRLAIRAPDTARTNSPVRDLDQIRQFVASPGPAALIDLPWVILFLGVLTAMHIWLGVATLVAALALASLTWMSDKASQKYTGDLVGLQVQRAQTTERLRRHAELIQANGMIGAMTDQHRSISARLGDVQRSFGEKLASFTGISRVARMFMQSVILTVGALLVLNGQATAGIIFASSILSGRALAPIDQAIGQWRSFGTARDSWNRLDATLEKLPPAPVPMQLPKPNRAITVDRIAVAPPGGDRLSLADITLQAANGHVIGVIGPSGSGKSTLLRAIVGVWPLARGSVRIDGASIDQFPPDVLGQTIGYLPQSIDLFAGTVAQNIARFQSDAQPGAIIHAAKLAGVHDLILSLAVGYDTELGEDGGRLSAGQRQRIGLARALYGDPFLIVLDEPNSNLDPEGEAALVAALMAGKKRGAITIVATHRQSVLDAATHVLFVRDGKAADFGLRDAVLSKVRRAATPGTAA